MYRIREEILLCANPITDNPYTDQSSSKREQPTPPNASVRRPQALGWGVFM
jgi:hypothetical protein